MVGGGGRMRATYGIETEYGVFRAVWNERGLYSLELPKPGLPADLAAAQTRDPRHADLARLLGIYLGGRAVDFRAVPLDPSGYTPFQKAVLDATAAIPPGETLTYRDVAGRVGRPRAARAVGNALGLNRTPVVVPCHRVVRSDGRIGGFSGGAGWKERLLAIEGTGLYSGGNEAI